jgi:hypothetical protein
MKWCRLDNDTVIEIIDFDPKGRFVKEIEEKFVKCTDEVKQGYEYNKGEFKQKVITLTKQQENEQIINEIKRFDTQLIRLIEDIAIWAETKGFEIPIQKKQLIEQRKQIRAKLKE